MRKLLALAVVLGMCLIPVMAWGIEIVHPLPYDADEVDAWVLTVQGWVKTASQGEPNTTALARCWRSGHKFGICNKKNWPIEVKIHASVAQWINFSICGTRWDWRVRKPGTYAADCIKATLKSNGPVHIVFDGFDDLIGGNPATNPKILTYYAYSDVGILNPTTLKWIEAPRLNELDFTMPDSNDLHHGYEWRLWNKIIVDDCNSACEYQDDAVITLSLCNQKCWIDPDTGYFKPIVFESPPGE